MKSMREAIASAEGTGTVHAVLLRRGRIRVERASASEILAALAIKPSDLREAAKVLGLAAAPATGTRRRLKGGGLRRGRRRSAKP